MFTLARNLVNYLREKSEKRCRLICVGLDGAGKTTLVGAASNSLWETRSHRPWDSKRRPSPREDFTLTSTT